MQYSYVIIYLYNRMIMIEHTLQVYASEGSRNNFK